MQIVVKRSYINTWIWYDSHQQKNGNNELMQAQEQIFINKLENRL